MPTAVPQRLSSRAEAIRFLLDAYAGARVRAGKGLPHAQTVADVLGDAGSDETTQLAGLLHDVVEDTPRTLDDVRDVFGDEVCSMVTALTEDEGIERYANRKRALREQIEAAGSPAIDIAVADKVATLRHAVVTGTKIAKRKLSHYRAVLALGEAAGVSERLSGELEGLLAEIARR
ncbi:MAG: diphosphokinase / guanosine-3,5-bis(diphosphate) 3-diphosphatase [Solirubrobacteraceae bacterium]